MSQNQFLNAAKDLYFCIIMKAPRIPSMFKQAHNQPRQFSFKPRVYDEDRERLKKRQKEIEAEVALEAKARQNPQTQERNHEQDNYLRFQRSKQARKSNIRLIIILTALLLGTYVMLQRLELLSQVEGSIF